VDPRERWQALQSHLHAARTRFESGDTAAALSEVDAALLLDPQFLAALTLRDRITAAARATAGKPDSIIGKTESPAAPPIVSAEGWARFESRARQRRMDRRLAAARSAIGRGRFDEARLAMTEVRGLDPHHPELIALGMELDAAEHLRAWRPRLGPSVAAAAAFSAIMLGASWLENTTGLLSHPIGWIAGLVPDSRPAPLLAVAASDITELVPGTPGDSRVRDARQLSSAPGAQATVAISPATSAEATPLRALPPEPTPMSVDALAPIAPAAVSAALLPVPAPPPSGAPIVAAAALVSPASNEGLPAAIDEERLVRQILQRYRAAYEGLDAQSAHAVWPAVNESALARAFDGLTSQRLDFEMCNVELAGPAAKAVCRGSARYVPKIGSREPRVEPRVWNFTLRKAGDDWQIENARAER
jgi:hypothetical protein